MRVMFRALFAAVLLAPVAIQGTASAALPIVVDETPVPSLSPMIKRVSPAVVNISTRGTVQTQGRSNPLLDDPFFRRFFDSPPNLGPRERSFQSAGSGVIFDAANGYIVTNAHVIENAQEISVTLQDGRELTAEVVGRDPPSDVAVVKVATQNLTQLAMGDSTRIEVGDFVVAIGNPFGLRHTVTSGIVSGLNRSPGINDQYEDFIQTDASINPGNSGGALVNLNGELIGINTAIFSGSGGNIGIGFAIPVNMARNVMDQIIEFGEVRRGLLGVQIQAVTSDIAKSLGLGAAQGALVTQVVEGSAAEKAGVKPGDVVTSVNGHPVRSNTELRNAIGLMRIGDEVEIGLLREGRAREVTAVIADAAGPQAKAGAPGEPIHRTLAGLSLADVPESGGVIVRKVEPGSPAQQAGLRENDVIVAANRLRVANVEQLRQLAKSATMLVLNVRRGRTALIIPLR
jgi:Do/DeqQ family serine protease